MIDNTKFVLTKGRRMFELTATLFRDVRVEYQYNFFEDIVFANQGMSIDASRIGRFLLEFDRVDVERAIDGLRKIDGKTIWEQMPMFSVENGIDSVPSVQAFVNFAGSIVDFLLVEKGLRELKSSFGVTRTAIRIQKNPAGDTVGLLFELKNKDVKKCRLPKGE